MQARLVARGFLQRGYINDCDIYSPVAKLDTFRILLAVGVQKGWEISQSDVCSAFLHGEIEEDIYLSLPKNCKIPQGKICKLKKSFYGLKGAPRCWYEKCHKFIISKGFTRSQYDQCLYFKIVNNKRMYVLIFVDDIITTGSCPREIESIKNDLKSTFKMKDLGILNS